MLKRRAGRGPPRLQPEVALFFLRLIWFSALRPERGARIAVSCIVQLLKGGFPAPLRPFFVAERGAATSMRLRCSERFLTGSYNFRAALLGRPFFMLRC